MADTGKLSYAKIAEFWWSKRFILASVLVVVGSWVYANIIVYEGKGARLDSYLNGKEDQVELGIEYKTCIQCVACKSTLLNYWNNWRSGDERLIIVNKGEVLLEKLDRTLQNTDRYTLINFKVLQRTKHQNKTFTWDNEFVTISCYNFEMAATKVAETFSSIQFCLK